MAVSEWIKNKKDKAEKNSHINILELISNQNETMRSHNNVLEWMIRET